MGETLPGQATAHHAIKVGVRLFKGLFPLHQVLLKPYLLFLLALLHGLLIALLELLLRPVAGCRQDIVFVASELLGLRRACRLRGRLGQVRRGALEHALHGFQSGPGSAPVPPDAAGLRASRSRSALRRAQPSGARSGGSAVRR